MDAQTLGKLLILLSLYDEKVKITDKIYSQKIATLILDNAAGLSLHLRDNHGCAWDHDFYLKDKEKIENETAELSEKLRETGKSIATMRLELCRTPESQL